MPDLRDAMQNIFDFQLQPADLRPPQGRHRCLMLFYEPLFLFLFFPATFIAYLAVRRRAVARVLVLLVASLFFYLWSEPLFVPVVLLTCVTDYMLARQVAAGGAGRCPLGVLINLGHAGLLQIHRVRRRQPGCVVDVRRVRTLARRHASRCRSACRSSCSRRSPTWSISPAAAAAQRRGSPPTCCMCSCSPSCSPARSSNTTSSSPNCSPTGGTAGGTSPRVSAGSCWAW